MPVRVPCACTRRSPPRTEAVFYPWGLAAWPRPGGGLKRLAKTSLIIPENDSALRNSQEIFFYFQVCSNMETNSGENIQFFFATKNYQDIETFTADQNISNVGRKLDKNN